MSAVTAMTASSMPESVRAESEVTNPTSPASTTALRMPPVVRVAVTANAASTRASRVAVACGPKVNGKINGKVAEASMSKATSQVSEAISCLPPFRQSSGAPTAAQP
jgi:hypothetical protein